MTTNSISTEVENIADAIASSERMASDQLGAARRILSLVNILTLTLMTILFSVFVLPLLSRAPEYKLNIPDAALYVFLAIYVLTFSVLMSIYRLHIGETARLQHYKVGFMRIRIAGSNASEGYQSEVRTALTKGAFEFMQGDSKKGKIESPIPGHPGSDLAAAIADKVLDSMKTVKRPKAPRSVKPNAEEA